MRPESVKLLHDVLQAARSVGSFIDGKSEADYVADELLRSAVERKVEIVGEAVSKLAKTDPDLARRITDWRKIIGFRNVLAHGYHAVDDRVTWAVAHDELPRLRLEVTVLLTEPPPTP